MIEIKKEVAVLNEAILRKNAEIKALKAEVKDLCKTFDEMSKLSQNSFRQGLKVQLDEVNHYKEELKKARNVMVETQTILCDEDSDGCYDADEARCLKALDYLQTYLDESRQNLENK